MDLQNITITELIRHYNYRNVLSIFLSINSITFQLIIIFYYFNLKKINM